MENTKVYEMVTDRIVKQLEQGVIPWNPHFVKVIDRHVNLKTRKPYNLINQILLSAGTEDHAATSRNVWATFKQWKDAGASVRKGEKSRIIISWAVSKKLIGEDAETGDPVYRDFVRPVYYNVFSIDQVDGIDRDKIMSELPERNDVIENAQDVLDQYWTREHIRVVEMETNRAFYSPSDDVIQLRALKQYDTANNYYRTAFHESVHSTGHKSRLDRFHNDAAAAFGGEEYSKEELTAELGSAFLMAMTGIETESTQEQNAAYIQGWLTALKNDSKMVVQAAARAEKAVEYIMNGYEPKMSEPVDTDVNVNVEKTTGAVDETAPELREYLDAYASYDSMYEDDILTIRYQNRSGRTGEMSVRMYGLTKSGSFKQLLSIMKLDVLHYDELLAHLDAYLKYVIGLHYCTAAQVGNVKEREQNAKEAERYIRIRHALGLCD
jgi:antirestriction protein ArdC